MACWSSTIGFHLLWHTVGLATSTRLCLWWLIWFLCFRFDALTELGAFMQIKFLCISVLRVASGPRVKLACCRSDLNRTVVYSTDRSKAVVPVLVLLFVCLCWGFMAQSPNGVISSTVSCLTIHLLGRLSPLSDKPVLCTFFSQKLTTALLESAEGREWP